MLGPEFWKRYFNVYDVLNLLQSYRELLDRIVEESHVKPGDLVLDAGVGTGNLAIRMERTGAKVVGLDFSQAALSACHAKTSNAQTILADLSKILPIEDNMFDIVVSNNTIYNIRRARRQYTIGELKRVLRPGGRIVIANIHNGFNPFTIYGDSLVKEYQKDGFLTMISLAARVLVPTIMIFYYNYCIKKEYSHDALLDISEQEMLLRHAGFQNVSKTHMVYTGQAILNSATKPQQ